jgi:gliding motility-associated-like protein
VDPVTLVVNQNPVIRITNRLDSYGLAAYNELCQAPVCLGKTNIQAAGNPPYCNTVGVLLKGNVTPVACGVHITDISWTTNTGTLVPGDQIRALAPGKYYLNYKSNTAACNRMDSFTVQFTPNAPLTVDTSYQLPIGCNCNGSITAIAGCGSGNYQYSWNTGATTATINNVCPGTYTVKVTDAGAGKDTTVRIVIPSSPNGITAYNITAIGDHCNQGDGRIDIASIQGGTAPFQYAINNQPFVATPNFTPLRAGMYTITVKDAANCALQQQATIQPVPAPQKLSYTKQDAYCGLLTGTVTIDKVQDGSPPFSFALNNGPFNPPPTFTNLLPGPGTITVKDNYGCTLKEPFTIFQSEQLRIALSPKDTNICASQQVTFMATVLSNSTGVQYNWNGTSSSNNVFTTPFYDHSKMILQATDNTGCTAFDSATITAPYCDSIFAKCVLFPNAFSPNNDGLNDSFGPHLGGCEMKSYQLSVYNRWGQLIFQTRDQSKKWTGATNGQTPQMGTYIFTCAWQDAVGHYHHHKGALVLIR